MLQYLLFLENLLLIKIQDGMRSLCMYVGVKGRGDEPDETFNLYFHHSCN